MRTRGSARTLRYQFEPTPQPEKTTYLPSGSGMKLTAVVLGCPVFRPRVVSSRTQRDFSNSAIGPMYRKRGVRSSVRSHGLALCRAKLGSALAISASKAQRGLQMASRADRAALRLSANTAQAKKFLL